MKKIPFELQERINSDYAFVDTSDLAIYYASDSNDSDSLDVLKHRRQIYFDAMLETTKYNFNKGIIITAPCSHL